MHRPILIQRAAVVPATGAGSCFWNCQAHHVLRGGFSVPASRWPPADGRSGSEEGSEEVGACQESLKLSPEDRWPGFSFSFCLLPSGQKKSFQSLFLPGSLVRSFSFSMKVQNILNSTAMLDCFNVWIC